MASFFGISSRFGRQAPKGNGPPLTKQTSPTSTTGSSLPYLDVNTPTTSNLASPTNETPVNTDNNVLMSNTSAPMSSNTPRRPPFFFREENTGLIVKGNFMTLAAKPEYVEVGEWMAHQVVEQYRLLEGLIKIIQEVDGRTGLPICNLNTCPTMSAGSYIYTWLDKQKNPIKIPAFQYIGLVQQWTLGKITDTRLFPIDTSGTNPATYPSGGQSNTSNSNAPIPAGPTNLNLPLSTLAGHDWLGKSSGFPESFQSDIRNLYRQMFRCYAHLYHSHWLEPFYHLSASKELNTCFLHFVNVGKLFDLLDDKDIVPMQPLVDIWLAKGLLPQAFGKQQSEQSQPMA